MALFDELLSMKKNDEDISDFHIREGDRIFYRRIGEIFSAEKIVSRIDIIDFLKEVGYISYLEEYENRAKNDGDFSFCLGVNRCRANIFSTNIGISIAIRILNNKIKTIDELGIPSQIKEVANLNHGLVVITGPTGSGKSTTLASIVDYINQNQNRHILTIEDPIEYLYENKKSLINQREVGTNCESFLSALKSSLRQDPDIIIVGEIRDEESLKIAMRASETGHLCICTLHTIGVMDTVERILDIFDTKNKEGIRATLSNIIKCVISQQLIKLKSETKRIPVFEVAFFDRSISSMVKEGRLNQISNYIISSGVKEMVSMDEKLLELYINKRISYDDLLFYCIDKSLIKNRLGKYTSYQKGIKP